mgnify:FL=1
MNSITGFPPITDKHSKVLILGSVPSEMSLLKQQYYGHPRNAFWPIMLAVLNIPTAVDKIPYSQRQKLLLKNNIAVWDVLQSCHRQGSLDTAIKMDSIKVNDFLHFFSNHTKIETICFNGAKSETVYNKHVLPHIKNEFGHLHYIKLPSTSPAHAAMTLQQKATIWSNCLKGVHAEYNKANRNS